VYKQPTSPAIAKDIGVRPVRRATCRDPTQDGRKKRPIQLRAWTLHITTPALCVSLARMKALLLMVTAMLVTGCFVQTRERRNSGSVQRCAPAHHWENGACVHNGKAKGHRK
jgi:hypothetical protein